MVFETVTVDHPFCVSAKEMAWALGCMLQLLYCFQDLVTPSNESWSCPLPETPCWGYFVVCMICYDGYFPDDRPSIKDLAGLARPEELNERLPVALTPRSRCVRVAAQGVANIRLAAAARSD